MPEGTVLETLANEDASDQTQAAMDTLIQVFGRTLQLVDIMFDALQRAARSDLGEENGQAASEVIGIATVAYAVHKAEVKQAEDQLRSALEASGVEIPEHLR